MSKFIKLTYVKAPQPGGTFYVPEHNYTLFNTEHITIVYKTGEYSTVVMDDGKRYTVKETREEILQQVKR